MNGARLLNIKSERPIASPRIGKTEQVSAGRFHNEARITSAADLDQELLGWLEKAYRISA